MPQVVYIAHDGTRHEIAAAEGDTVMSAAVLAGIPGIDADCGGGCSCGTCHVVVDPGWQAALDPPGAMEEGMLRLVPAREPGSRLSCQIPVTAALDGLVVRLPEFQM